MKSLADQVLDGYWQGAFPMADSAEDESFYLVTPYVRALLPIQNLHISRSLRRHINKQNYSIKINTAFERVITCCAEKTDTRQETWINPQIKALFMAYHARGIAHSVEYWEDNTLKGGLYGLSLGTVFCGESMFSRATNASKVALVHLCARLLYAGYTDLDAQFSNPHLEQFGLYEMPQEDYVEKLQKNRHLSPDFSCGKTSEWKILDDYFKTRAKNNK